MELKKMEKSGSPALPKKARPAAQSGRAGRPKKVPQRQANPGSGRTDIGRMIEEIREQIEFHHGCASELKAQLEKLTGAAPEPPAGRPETNGVKNILVVDDDHTTVKIITHFLEKENYRVTSSFSGLDGLKKTFAETPDLILLDVMMPDLNGFQFLSILHKDREKARVPVVILSSLAEEADVLKGLEIGAVDYITKPFSPQVLVAKIKKNLNCGP
jgi:CheY-like chemotaxis protein